MFALDDEKRRDPRPICRRSVENDSPIRFNDTPTTALPPWTRFIGRLFVYFFTWGGGGKLYDLSRACNNSIAVSQNYRENID